MKKKSILRIASIVLTGAGFITLVPFPLSGQTAIVGYKALCPFAPISTVLMVYAGLIIHRYLENQKEVTHGEHRTNPG